jgi:processive 1,2-diacylglycerol beta-glucosyltransferase
VKRLLVLSASAGAGHLRAAEAVELASKERWPDADVRHVDVLTLMPAPFRRVYGKGYLDFVNRAPELVGMLYDRSNRPPRNPAGDRLRLLAERVNARPLVEFVRDFDPDVVCLTHFLSSQVVAHQRKKGRLRAPHAVVVTDYDVHRFWLCPDVRRYFVAREENRVHLEARGEASDRISTTGIPIHPEFSRPADVAALRRKHAVDGSKPLLLVLCGGFGVGPVESLVEALAASVGAAQLVVIAGRNEELRERLEKVARRAPLSPRVLGFTTEMHEWMALANLLVTKPGGLTTTEALALGVPMVLANAIPGQETRNAAMLYEAGAAISGENPLTVAYRVARLLESPDRLAAMRAAALRLGRPDAAARIAGELGELR